MSDRTVFVHVGLPKSGTSYLQRLLTANKAELGRRAGLLFPGEAWNRQVAAVRDLRQLRGRPVQGAWQRLVDEIAAWPGNAVISMEWLCAANEEQIRRVESSLAPARVEVVFTARDLGRTLPAAWQEFVQNENAWSWPEFLDAVTAKRATAHPAGRLFWSQQDLPQLLARWSSVVDLDRLHVVTLPHPGAPRDVLWRRFADVLGLEPDGYVTEDLGGNESLGLESTELVRRVNERLAELGLEGPAYTRLVKHQLAKRVLSRRRRDESTLAVPPERWPWVRDAAARHAEAVRRSGVHVVGDLAELEPVLDRPGRQPEQVGDAELLDAAVAALVGLVELRSQRNAPQEAPGDAADRA